MGAPLRVLAEVLVLGCMLKNFSWLRLLTKPLGLEVAGDALLHDCCLQDRLSWHLLW